MCNVPLYLQSFPRALVRLGNWSVQTHFIRAIYVVIVCLLLSCADIIDMVRNHCSLLSATDIIDVQ